MYNKDSNISQNSSKSIAPKRGIVYYRHSAEDKQEFSIPVQREQVHKFASKHNIRIIKEFEDAGKSGLLSNRPGFISLYEFAKKERFDFVLVLNVTRWGRFQDTDESAYYEILFKREGKKVIYIDKGFINNEHPLVGSLIKSIDRYMAADYSRKLSETVFLGSMKIASLGFSVGGRAPYGLKRLLLDINKNPIRILNDGERKCIDNERVTFTLGEKEDVEIIKRMFNLFVNEKLSTTEISTILNNEGKRSTKGKFWDSKKLTDILRNENYIGIKVYNKTSKKLKGPSKNNPKEEWIRCLDAFEAIISTEIFYKTQERLDNLKVRYTQEQLLTELAKIYEKYKEIKSSLINEWKDTGCAGTYTRRFVSLYNSYIKVNYLPKRAFKFLNIREKQRFILTGIIKERLKRAGYQISYSNEFLIIDYKKVLIIPSIPRKRKEHRYWTFFFETRDIDYALCVGFTNKESTDVSKYFLFPKDFVEENVININTSHDEKYDGYVIPEIENIVV